MYRQTAPSTQDVISTGVTKPLQYTLQLWELYQNARCRKLAKRIWHRLKESLYCERPAMRAVVHKYIDNETQPAQVSVVIQYTWLRKLTLGLPPLRMRVNVYVISACSHACEKRSTHARLQQWLCIRNIAQWWAMQNCVQTFVIDRFLILNTEIKRCPINVFYMHFGQDTR